MEKHEVIKTWEELEIKDDFMFAKVMRDKEIRVFNGNADDK